MKNLINLFPENRIIGNMVRVLLRRYKYPPDKADEAIDLVLK